MKRLARHRVDGVLLLDKPRGLSSNAALQRVRRLFAAEKAGHTGTLDPLATGLLPIALGEATKFAHALLDAPKRYEATIRLGSETATGDAEGEVVRTLPANVSREALEELLPRFVGRQFQTPPRHAALKHRGRPYYEWTRAGVDVPRLPREIEIASLALVVWRPPDVVIDVVCSKGTYIRVLAEDLGIAAGTCAHLAALRRTATGAFSIADAVPLDRLEAMDEAERRTHLRPVDVLVTGMPRIDLADDAAARFLHGVPVPVGPDREAGRCVVYAGGVLLGLADLRGGVAHPARLLATPRVEPVSY